MRVGTLSLNSYYYARARSGGRVYCAFGAAVSQIQGNAVNLSVGEAGWATAGLAR